MEALEELNMAGVAQAPPISTLNRSDGWKAELTLGFTDRGDKTVVGHKTQLGPLAIQRPLYPEGDVCHTYLLHPPGGVVGGDELLIKATAYPGAHALVTTPGATKFYRSEGRDRPSKTNLNRQVRKLLGMAPAREHFLSYRTSSSRY